jgi:hypothetical protein
MSVEVRYDVTATVELPEHDGERPFEEIEQAWRYFLEKKVRYLLGDAFEDGKVLAIHRVRVTREILDAPQVEA